MGEKPSPPPLSPPSLRILLLEGEEHARWQSAMRRRLLDEGESPHAYSTREQGAWGRGAGKEEERDRREVNGERER